MLHNSLGAMILDRLYHLGFSLLLLIGLLHVVLTRLSQHFPAGLRLRGGAGQEYWQLCVLYQYRP